MLSPVIPLIPPLICLKRRHAVLAELVLRIEIDRRYFPPKSRYSRRPIFFKKNAFTFLFIFHFWCRKANPIGEADFRRKKRRRWNVFFWYKRKLSHTHIFASQTQNSVTTVTKSSVVETKQTFGPIISYCTWGKEKFSTTSSPLFSFNTLNLTFIWSDVGIGLFEFHFDAICLIYSFCLTVFGVSWRPRFWRGSCQVDCLVPTSWEPPVWSMRTPVSIICKHCLWKGAFSDNLLSILSSSDRRFLSF